MIDTYALNFYDELHVEPFKLQLRPFVEHLLRGIEYIVLLTECTSNIDGVESSEKFKIINIKITREKEMNSYYHSDNWRKSIKHEFMWFILQYAFSYR